MEVTVTGCTRGQHFKQVQKGTGKSTEAGSIGGHSTHCSSGNIQLRNPLNGWLSGCGARREIPCAATAGHWWRLGAEVDATLSWCNTEIFVVSSKKKLHNEVHYAKTCNISSLSSDHGCKRHIKMPWLQTALYLWIPKLTRKSSIGCHRTQGNLSK